MLGGKLLAAGKQLVKQGFIKCIGLAFIDTGKRGAGHHGTTQVIQFGRLGGEIRDDVTQAGATGQLGHGECDELRPARHFTQLLALMVLINEGLEFMSRKKF